MIIGMPLITVRVGDSPWITYRVDGARVSIGRSPECDLVLGDASLSRLHAELRRQDAGWEIVDLGSRHGTFVNGARIDGSLAVGPGDEITLGSSRVLLDSEAGVALRMQAARITSPPPAESGVAPHEIVAESASMRAILSLADKFAASTSTVLVRGESGTGKELLARRIHAKSPRAGAAFIVVNCPAVPGSLFESELFGVEKGIATGVNERPGRLELADGGTVFLDEVGDLDLEAQAKLLRFLQDRSLDRVGARIARIVDVRVVAATNHDLEERVAAKAFRLDLFHRLKVASLVLPPLRERKDDIPALAERFLGGPGRVSEAALQVLESHDYPGNVRELEHLLERARLVSETGVVEPADLELRSSAKASPPPAQRDAAALERRLRDGASFWDEVHGPFLRREISRETARELLRRGVERCGSYKLYAGELGIGAEYKRFVNFLRNHGLRIEDPEA